MGITVTILDEQVYIDDLIIRSLSEDLGVHGDITSRSIFEKSDTAQAVIRSKASGTLSGAWLLKPLFSKIDASLSVTILKNDGDILEKGTEICRLNGAVQSILAGERVALNFLQRLSGIATQTALLVKEIAHTKTRLLDTRKTTPSLRLVEKRAVLHGGGCNHRFGLFDMILIKDTHVKRAGGVVPALEKAFQYSRGINKVAVEVEVQTVEEFSQALALGPERIMLDNMSLDTMKTCVGLAQKAKSACELEASGNITAKTIREVAETGVDFISCGSITHSAPSLDIHLIIV